MISSSLISRHLARSTVKPMNMRQAKRFYCLSTFPLHWQIDQLNLVFCTKHGRWKTKIVAFSLCTFSIAIGKYFLLLRIGACVAQLSQHMSHEIKSLSCCRFSMNGFKHATDGHLNTSLPLPSGTLTPFGVCDISIKDANFSFYLRCLSSSNQSATTTWDTLTRLLWDTLLKCVCVCFFQSIFIDVPHAVNMSQGHKRRTSNEKMHLYLCRFSFWHTRSRQALSLEVFRI